MKQKFDNLTAIEQRVFKYILSNPNSHQGTICDKCEINPRKLRKAVNNIRKQGWFPLLGEQMFLIADVKGYNWEPKGSLRAIQWRENTLAKANDMHKLVINFDKN